jgi:hypothetical protein
MDFAEGFGIDVAGALLDKVEFNLDRPYKHGKEF